MARTTARLTTKHVETLKHDEAKRKNIPSAEQQSFVQKEQENPKQIHYLSRKLELPIWHFKPTCHSLITSCDEWRQLTEGRVR